MREQEQQRVVIQVLAGVALQLGHCFSKLASVSPDTSKRDTSDD